MSSRLVATSPAQLHILEHALGLDQANEPYRNYYVAIEGNDNWGDLVELEKRGLMDRQRIAVAAGVATGMFHVTDAGRDLLRMRGKLPAVQRDLNFGENHG
tara:strand:+ start:847 stop:1149 length:303 start_codon:yes stop_codon:yes gene_type:complete